MERRQKWLSESLLIAVSPLLAYLITFVFEFGYSYTFNIPTELISPNVTTVFIVAVSLLITSFPIITFINTFLVLFDNKSPLFRYIINISPLYIMYFSLIILSIKQLYFLIFVIVLIILTSIYFFLSPLITYRSEETYNKKLDAKLKSDSEINNIGKRLNKFFGFKVSSIIIWIYVVLSITYFAGFFSARNQEKFLITSTKPEMIILRKYGDQFICATFDRQKKLIHQQFTIIKFDSKISFKFEKLGIMTAQK